MEKANKSANTVETTVGAQATVTDSSALVAKIEKAAVAKIERQKATTQFAELVFVKSFLQEVEKLSTSGKRAFFTLTNANMLNNYAGTGFNFLCLPDRTRFSKLVAPDLAGLQELQQLIANKQFKGSQLLVYTKSKGGHIVGKVSEFKTVAEVFEVYDKVKEIDLKKRIIKSAKVSLSEAVKLAEKQKVETLIGSVSGLEKIG